MTGVHLQTRGQRHLGGLWREAASSTTRRLWDPVLVGVLSPLLILYASVTLWNWPTGWVADELRYVRFACELCQGGYALEDDDYLWNGPGFPLVIAAWMAAGVPPAWARVANAGFLFAGVVLFAHLMALHVPRRWAAGAGWAMGLHWPLFPSLGRLMTESLALCLVCGWLLAATLALRDRRPAATISAGFLLGWLALTKVFFGYVLLAGFLAYVLLLAIRPRSAAVRRMAVIYLMALVTTVPYLAYTYYLTGKVFYWSNSGGLSLYWMSTPYREEWGDWFHPRDVRQRPELARHRPFFESIADHSPVAKDEAYRRQAMMNIRSHPKKFVTNVLANVSRMWFSFPYSYTPQKLRTLFYVLPNSVLLSGLGVSAVIFVARKPPAAREIHFVIVFMCLTLSGSSLLSAYARMLDPLVPGAYLLLGIAAHAAWGKMRAEASRLRSRG